MQSQDQDELIQHNTVLSYLFGYFPRLIFLVIAPEICP